MLVYRIYIYIFCHRNQTNELEVSDNLMSSANSLNDGVVPKRTSKPGPPKKIFRWNIDCKYVFAVVVCVY